MERKKSKFFIKSIPTTKQEDYTNIRAKMQDNIDVLIFYINILASFIFLFNNWTWSPIFNP